MFWVLNLLTNYSNKTSQSEIKVTGTKINRCAKIRDRNYGSQTSISNYEKQRKEREIRQRVCVRDLKRALGKSERDFVLMNRKELIAKAPVILRREESEGFLRDMSLRIETSERDE